MPRYSCKEVLREKLKYAIHFCKSIDTDDYARVALTGDGLDPESPDGSEDSDYPDICESEGEVMDSDGIWGRLPASYSEYNQALLGTNQNLVFKVNFREVNSC